jgi:hypothetical protein
MACSIAVAENETFFMRETISMAVRATIDDELDSEPYDCDRLKQLSPTQRMQFATVLLIQALQYFQYTTEGADEYASM